MQWKGRKSENVEDRRGVSVSRGIMGGGIGTIILVLVALYFGVDPSILLNQGTTQHAGGPPRSVSRERPAEENRMADFVSVVLADTEDTFNSRPLQSHGFHQTGNTERLLFEPVIPISR